VEHLHKGKPVATILLVDDDENATEALGELLNRKGYGVATALDGQQALDYLRANLPSLIVLDLSMPRMDGWQFLTHRARDERLSSIPVVIVSATETNRPGNVTAVLRKPLHMRDLDNVFEERTAERASRSDARTRAARE
jgi:CheY-like chemotaxis protein